MLQARDSAGSEVLDGRTSGRARPRVPAGTGQEPGVVVIDLDRTITRSGTFTPFILGYLLRERPWRLLRLFGFATVLVRYMAGRMTRLQIKEDMLARFLAGEPRTRIQAWAGEFSDRLVSFDVRPRALATIRRYRLRGHRLVLATASFDFYAEAIGRRLGFDAVLSTRSSWDSGGLLLPRIAGPNHYGPEKLAAVAGFVASLGRAGGGRSKAAGSENREEGLREADCADAEVIYDVTAFSDHHSDLALLEWATTGIAVNPTATLRRRALKHGLAIEDWNEPVLRGRRTPAVITRLIANPRPLAVFAAATALFDRFAASR